jgi:hypothetical protein
MPQTLLHFRPLLLAQYNPYDDAPPPPPPPPVQRPMSFSDLKQGLRDVHNGNVDNSFFRNSSLSLLAVLALIVLLLHLRQRHQNTISTVPNNLRRLSRELGRFVPFPWGTKLILKWVARSTGAPYPALLLSSELFDQSINAWSRQPTFALARGWGKARLERLRSVLFEKMP